MAASQPRAAVWLTRGSPGRPPPSRAARAATRPSDAAVYVPRRLPARLGLARSVRCREPLPALDHRSGEARSDGLDAGRAQWLVVGHALRSRRRGHECVTA